MAQNNSQSLADKMTDTIESLKAEIAERDERIRRLKIELDGAFVQNYAFEEKIRYLSPHGTCACSYDQPDDICGHHSPAVTKRDAEIDALNIMVDQLNATIDTISADYHKVVQTIVSKGYIRDGFPFGRGVGGHALEEDRDTRL